ncbi:hypothetical protein [Nonomuraea sp. KM88]|uniref:hypothetical protein n=1 Tax=Nonomuraea sp. KM88 TaxID=3457427 RepID=UPI003FCDE072
MVRQAQAGGDAFDDGELFDGPAAVEDLVDARLAETGGGAYSDLAGTVFVGKTEKSGDVAVLEYFPGFVPIPDCRR